VREVEPYQTAYSVAGTSHTVQIECAAGRVIDAAYQDQRDRLAFPVE
jgi:hypothetical protein